MLFFLILVSSLLWGTRPIAGSSRVLVQVCGYLSSTETHFRQPTGLSPPRPQSGPGQLRLHYHFACSFPWDFKWHEMWWGETHVWQLTGWNWRRHCHLQLRSPCNGRTFFLWPGLSPVLQTFPHISTSGLGETLCFSGKFTYKPTSICKVGLSACTLPKLKVHPGFLILLQQNKILLSDNK